MNFSGVTKRGGEGPWALVEAAAYLLDRDQRDAVLGDLYEAGDSAARAVGGIVGMAMRRSLSPWGTRQAWIAAFGLALPASFLLMGFSVGVTQTARAAFASANTNAHAANGSVFVWLSLQAALLAVWAWTGGYVAGRMSRRTVWATAAMCLAPCVFCLSRFRVPEMNRSSLLLFAAPAIWGAVRGYYGGPIRRSLAIALAIAATVLTLAVVGWKVATISQWAMLWPAWYLVATTSRSNEGAEGTGTDLAGSEER